MRIKWFGHHRYIGMENSDEVDLRYQWFLNRLNFYENLFNTFITFQIVFKKLNYEIASTTLVKSESRKIAY